jgi:hypothetical protein
MKAEDLKKKLIAVARANSPSDLVPPGFERRIMALISARPIHDLWAVWAKGLWYAVGPCVAITLLFSAWAAFGPLHQKPSVDLAQQLNNTLLAAVDQDNNDSTW